MSDNDNRSVINIALQQHAMTSDETPDVIERATRLVTVDPPQLVCWCPLDQPCHADVLLELANEARR